MASDNPFDELELDPRLSPHELTEALRRRAERAEGAERARIQELWRTLTLNESDRIRWAFFAHPRAEDGAPGSIATLRGKIPAVISRKTPDAIEPLVGDVADFGEIAIDVATLRPRHPFDD